MKRYTIAFALLALVSCGKFTEIDPKGQNLLDRVTDLDQLLNYQFSGGAATTQMFFEMNAASALVNDLYPRALNVPNTINTPVKNLNTITLTWDETADRAALTASDTGYELFYSIIGKVANPVLLMVDNASGDRGVAARLKAEAHVLRAYFHYLAVNLFAKAYHPETADTDGGVPYARENDLLSVPNPKYSVQEVYDFILADLQAAFDLNSLPDHPSNPMRVGKPFAYAVEAKVRMSMHDFEGAEAAANRSLALQDEVEDYRDHLVPGANLLGVAGTYFHHPELECAEDLFYISSTYLALGAFTLEMSAAFEPGDIFFDYLAKYNAFGPAAYGLSGIDVMAATTVFKNSLGLTTVEMHLTVAECMIRSGRVTAAMDILNAIRQKRVEPCTPVPATDAADAFALLKRVSRTETWFGPRHFIDLKRWNTEAAHRETLRKTLLGTVYELRPDSPLWVFPFPQNATGFNPNLTQNYE
ncbi:MAG: RagB/SusD family nutrient uptake outer membrane protein [Odoribacteraceae bacterium]|jgi:hypothetical protein|nr:RagB/SusD family nutrient uptake outer membrane protein [Odoribacteraceae bacterium]